MKAYLLAAGYATRMYPLTRDLPKTLLRVGGRPILEHTLDRLRRLEGLSEIVVVTNHRFFEPIRAWVDGYDAPAAITVLDDGSTSEEDRLGAIGDLAFALERVPPDGEDAIVLASDQLVELDLTEVQKTFHSRAGTTVVVRRVDHGPGPSPYNDVVLDEEGGIVRFREKPTDPEGDLAAICLYLLPPDDLALVPEYLRTGNPDAPGHFIEWLAGRRPCWAHRMTGAWYDIGSLESLARAREALGE